MTRADLVIANLLVEYIGYACFQKAIARVNPRYVSCIIQINEPGSWYRTPPICMYLTGWNRYITKWMNKR